MAKINVSLPDDLLEDVDHIAGELQRSRSGLVAEATARYVSELRQERAELARRQRIDAAIETATRIGRSVEPFDTAAAVRTDRDRDEARGAGE